MAGRGRRKARSFLGIPAPQVPCLHRPRSCVEMHSRRLGAFRHTSSLRFAMTSIKPLSCVAVVVLLTALLAAPQQQQRAFDFETGKVVSSPKVDETRAAMTATETGASPEQRGPNPTVRVGDKIYVLGVDTWEANLEKTLQQGRLVAIKIKGDKAAIEDAPGHTVTLPIVSHSKAEQSQ